MMFNDKYDDEGDFNSKKNGGHYFDILKKRLGNLTDYENIGKTHNDKHSYFLTKMLNSDPSIKLPAYSKNCVCTHRIIHNCYIRNIHTKSIYIVGNCCIHRFNITKKCSLCNKPHNRSKNIICTDCEKTNNKLLTIHKKTLGNTICYFGKHKYKTYKEIVTQDLPYIRWCNKIYKQCKSDLFHNLISYVTLYNPKLLV